MTGPDHNCFDGPAFVAAIEARRSEQALSWAQLGRLTGVSPATIKRFSSGNVIEADGVLALLRWLGRPLEDFSATNSHLNSGRPPAQGPPGTMLRRDTRRLYEALAERVERDGITMVQAGAACDTTAAQLRGLATGGRTDIRTFLRVLNYLGADFHGFTRFTRS